MPRDWYATYAVSASRSSDSRASDGRLLSLRAAAIDARVEVEHGAAAGVERRIARGDAAHRIRRLAMAARATALRRAGRRLPEFTAAVHPEQPGIGRVVGLHRAHVGAGERDARAQRGGRQRTLLRECARPRSDRAASAIARAASADRHGGALGAAHAGVVDPFERQLAGRARRDEEAQVGIGGDARAQLRARTRARRCSGT